MKKNLVLSILLLSLFFSTEMKADTSECKRFDFKCKSKKFIEEKINNSIDESAYLLGYSKIKTFLKIHVPYLSTNIILIVLLISLEVIKELPMTMILRPFNFETFATQAYIYASQDLLEAAALPSLFLIFWSTILILLSSKYILSKKN